MLPHRSPGVPYTLSQYSIVFNWPSGNWLSYRGIFFIISYLHSMGRVWDCGRVRFMVRDGDTSC